MNSKKKIKVDAIIFSFIFIALIVFGLSPLLSELFKITKELSSRKILLNTLEEQISALQDFQNNSPAYTRDIQKIDNSFVSEEAPIEFIEFLEKLANNQGLKVSLSSVKDASEKKGNRLTTAFEIAVVGDYPVVLSFLKKLEQSSWLMKIDRVDISKGKNSQVILGLGLKTFSNYLGTTQ